MLPEIGCAASWDTIWFTTEPFSFKDQFGDMCLCIVCTYSIVSDAVFAFLYFEVGLSLCLVSAHVIYSMWSSSLSKVFFFFCCVV